MLMTIAVIVVSPQRWLWRRRSWLLEPFSDLIKPMPIMGELRSDLWGAESVLPRDPDNGWSIPIGRIGAVVP